MDIVLTKSNQLSDSYLENAAGGFNDLDPGIFYQMRYKFNAKDIEILKNEGYQNLPTAGKSYTRDEVNKMLGTNADNREQMRDILTGVGMVYRGKY